MRDDRSAVISIDGVHYELLLTTRATKEIAEKCGGLERLGEQLARSENLAEAFDLVLWLITLLANQSILRHNYKNKQDMKPLLTIEELELMTTPLDVMDFKDAIMETVSKGMARHIESEDDGKNTEAG